MYIGFNATFQVTYLIVTVARIFRNNSLSQNICFCFLTLRQEFKTFLRYLSLQNSPIATRITVVYVVTLTVDVGSLLQGYLTILLKRLIKFPEP